MIFLWGLVCDLSWFKLNFRICDGDRLFLLDLNLEEYCFKGYRLLFCNNVRLDNGVNIKEVMFKN